MTGGNFLFSQQVVRLSSAPEKSTKIKAKVTTA